ncbi:MAG TPA: phosphate uptake regulator PhoU [Candidatus Thermoplasmatota archaeon]|nr:phosphate uptake regulator PhoU [Candidatus Thermoplasmatota archaeon]
MPRTGGRAPRMQPSANPRAPALELRKIQVTGGASFTVTLPKEWVEKARLAQGDLIGFVPQSDGSLAVYPHARMTPLQTRQDVELSTEDAEAAFRKIVAAYLMGYDIIVVKSRKGLTPAARRAVRLATKRIIGIEVLEEENDRVVLQDLLDPREFPIEKGLRRMEVLTRAMQEEGLRAFHEDIELDDAFQERDDEVDRLYWMVNKQYHGVMRDPTYAQRLGVTPSQALNYLIAARLIERTADHAHRLAKNLQALREGEHQAKLDAKLEKQAKRATQLFTEALASFHRQDADGANKLIAEAQAFRTTQDAVMREALSLGGESIVHVAYALDSIARTAAYAADVAETAINQVLAMRQ